MELIFLFFRIESNIFMVVYIKYVCEYSEYFAEWENIRARVVRPDVQCIDGVIHVIDHVLVQRREISVSGSGRFAVDALLLLSVTLTAIFLNARALQH